MWTGSADLLIQTKLLQSAACIRKDVRVVVILKPPHTDIKYDVRAFPSYLIDDAIYSFLRTRPCADEKPWCPIHNIPLEKAYYTAPPHNP